MNFLITLTSILAVLIAIVLLIAVFTKKSYLNQQSPLNRTYGSYLGVT